jgi:hypothetical protein
MKKRVFVSLVLLTIIGVGAVFAQQPTPDKLAFRVDGQNEYRVLPANNSISGEVVIPATYEGRPVVATHQSGSLFQNITGITSLTILSNGFQINGNSFRGCTGLTSVSLAPNVHILNNAFDGCTNLTSVTFGEGSFVNGSFPKAFPGDLVAKFNARTGGGPGVYTRQRGSDTWTRTGNAPAPVITVNTSLNGIWEAGGWQFTINGSTGTVSTAGTTNAVFLDAINRGMFKVGDQFFRNIRSTGNLTWSGEQLQVTSKTPGVAPATGTSWGNCTITMNADGRTILINGGTYTRR